MSVSSSVENRPSPRFGKRTVFGANVVVMVVIALAIYGIVSYVNARHYHRFDCTATGKFSLTSKTKNILEGLKEPIMISTLFNRGDRFTVEKFEQVRDILEEYAYVTDKIKVEHIDPLREQTKVELLTKRIDIEQIALNSVIFESQGRSKHVDLKELIEKKFPFNFRGEEAFTAAIIAVSEKNQSGVYFVTGHGERSIDDYNPGGFSDIANALRRDNYGTISWDLLSKKKIPDDCEVLVIAGVTKGLSTEEANIIHNYLDDGGKALVMLEPALGRNKPSGLKGLLKDYNVEIKENCVIYNEVNTPFFGLQTRAEVYVSEEKYQEHNITKDLTKLTTVFFGSIPVDIVSVKEVKKGFHVWKLANAPDRAWGETHVEKGKKPVNDKEADVQPPISLAVAVEPVDPETAASVAHGAPAPKPGSEVAKGPRLVVFGDTDFASNDYVRNYPGNLDIFLNSIMWLAQKETQLGISAKSQDVRMAVIRPVQARVIYWLTVFGIPVIGIVIGGVVWWQRRR